MYLVGSDYILMDVPAILTTALNVSDASAAHKPLFNHYIPFRCVSVMFLLLCMFTYNRAYRHITMVQWRW